MNSAIRWRIVTLQVVLVVVLAAASGFLFYEGNFVRNMIGDELSAQQITFPTTAALAQDTRSSEYSSDFKSYAGQQLTNGDQAKAYADGYLGVHLKETAGGLTYATIGTKISAVNAQLANTPKTDPSYTTLQQQVTTLNAQRDTLFKGETLRSMLLNAYGWWTVGTYTLYAAAGLLVAALGVLGALVFELLIVARRPEKFKVTQTVAA